MNVNAAATVGVGRRWVIKCVTPLVVAGTMLACSSGPEKPKPAELSTNVALVNARLAWSARLGSVNFPLDIAVNSRSNVLSITAAGSDGVVASFDASNGRELWRSNIGAAIAAGVGSDGVLASVITNANEIVTMEGGRVLWRQKLNASSYTAPLVAGGRVFVLSSDRSVTAFDGQSGRKLWSQKRTNEALVLRQSGVLLAVDDTLVVGLSGRLVGMNPLDGSVRWETPLATARGTNDVERLVDLVGRVSREGSVVCARSFRVSVGCVNADRGTLLWTKPASGSEGVHGDERAVFGVESDGRVIAWNRINGERLWSTERLQYRSLTAPVVVGRSVAIGDSTGLVHLLSRKDGSPLTRLSTDGSAVATTPILAGNTLVVVTRNGGIYGFLPE
ncbi:MAG: outer membrane protein assembly factor BamB [Cellvibrio sp.]|uniref:outer membrane protein assembly factor BamB n=1 Tax=Cellvibrio sp. TaxID=1965322 RepID=UPI002728CE3B|nr:outer membrane protein assembly factor BamB [Cellvibrio sp.]